MTQKLRGSEKKEPMCEEKVLRLKEITVITSLHAADGGQFGGSTKQMNM